MKPQKSNIELYQGTTYRRTFNFTEGSIIPIESIVSGNNTRVNLKGGHNYSVGDYVFVSNVDISPFLTKSYRVITIPTSNSVVLDVETDFVRSVEGGFVQRATSLTGAVFKGMIKQSNLTTLGNVLASTSFNSRKVRLNGTTPLKVRDRITINDASLLDVEIIGIEHLNSARGPYQVLTLSTPSPSNTENVVVEYFSTELAQFQFETELIKGRVTARVSAQDSSNLVPTNGNRNYFYDIKYKIGEEIFTLVFGEVRVIPQVTDPSVF